MLLFDKSVTDVEGNPVLVHVVWAQVKATTTHKKVVCVANRIFQSFLHQIGWPGLFVPPDNHFQTSGRIGTHIRQCLVGGLKRSTQDHRTIENLSAAPSSSGSDEAHMFITRFEASRPLRPRSAYQPNPLWTHSATVIVAHAPGAVGYIGRLSSIACAWLTRAYSSPDALSSTHPYTGKLDQVPCAAKNSYSRCLDGFQGSKLIPSPHRPSPNPPALIAEYICRPLISACQLLVSFSAKVPFLGAFV